MPDKPAAKPVTPQAAAASAPAAPSAPSAPEPAPNQPSPQPAPETPQPAMSEADRLELEAFRAAKAAKVQAAQSAINADGTPNLDLHPVKQREAFMQLSVDNQIRAHYLHARGTIQDYARLFGKTVEQVLHILDLDDVAEVETLGDQIGDDELAPGDAPNKRTGTPAKVPFSLN